MKPNVQQSGQRILVSEVLAEEKYGRVCVSYDVWRRLDFLIPGKVTLIFSINSFPPVFLPSSLLGILLYFRTGGDQ